MTTPERERRNWLLELDATIHRDQEIVASPHPAQEVTILDAAPAAAGHGIDTVAAELRGEVYREVFVKMDAH